MPNMNYWSNRKERQEHAELHTMLMEQHYKEEIKKSVANSVIYNPGSINYITEKTPRAMEVSLVNEGSVDTIMRLAHHDNMAVLNFASYTHPGGQFLNGSSAQEESLCHESTLYNVLSEFHQYYSDNHNTRNNFMYTNRAIYSPDIIFMRDGWAIPCGVITCASPNIAGNRKICQMKVSNSENEIVLRDRCEFILSIAKDQNVKTLILGAFGCGVFGQNPETVATYFCELLTGEYQNCFDYVVFAIPIMANPENYNAFEKVLKQYALI